MDDRNERLDDTSTSQRAAPRRDVSQTRGDEIGEAAGGVSGVVVGAAVGSLAGPVGTVIGGIAGAIGGWWAGRSIAEAAQNYSPADDAVYRSHYENSASRLADREYEDVSPAYRLGHLAAHNPDYRGRPFNDVESDLQRGWNDSLGKSHGDWDSVRGFANNAYDRSASRLGHPMREDANVAADEADKRLDDTSDLNLI